MTPSSMTKKRSEKDLDLIRNSWLITKVFAATLPTTLSASKALEKKPLLFLFRNSERLKIFIRRSRQTKKFSKKPVLKTALSDFWKKERKKPTFQKLLAQ